MTGDQTRNHHRSFLAAAEQRLIAAILPQISEQVTPRRLTRLGLIGAFIAASALIGCRWTPAFLPLMATGVLINWFGISLDGPLARYRNDSSGAFGFVEHVHDLFSQIVILVGFGLSPYLSPEAALVILFCYLIFSAYTYLRTASQSMPQMAYIGIGATEYRMLMIVYAIGAAAMGVNEIAEQGFSMLDQIIVILAVLALGGLAVKIVIDARHISAQEDRS